MFCLLPSVRKERVHRQRAVFFYQGKIGLVSRSWQRGACLFIPLRQGNHLITSLRFWFAQSDDHKKGPLV